MAGLPQLTSGRGAATPHGNDGERSFEATTGALTTTLFVSKGKLGFRHASHRISMISTGLIDQVTRSDSEPTEY